MVHRDPETGQFVSGASAGDHLCFEDLNLLHGNTSMRIDAADLDGSEQTFDLDQGNAVIDFGAFLDDFDVAEVVWLWLSANLSAPTTSTAEGYVFAKTQVRSEPETEPGMGGLNPLSGADFTEDSIDVQTSGKQDNETLVQFTQAATDSNRDTASGTAAGSDIDRINEQVFFRTHFGGGPVFDEDDELYIQSSFTTDNIDDHRILQSVDISMAVKEWDIDECPVLSQRRRR